MFGVDGGSEFGQATSLFKDSKLAVYTAKQGIVVLTTTPHTPWMNGRIERAAAIMVEKTRTTMLAYGIPYHLWPFVLDTAVLVSNLLPTRANEG
ncbi:hypothetical protein QBC35DRAFT_396799, partial [Podospora australis]